MIGDSILASTSSRYGDQMCEAVVPLGWQVAVEAEPSRFIEFGNTVLDRLLPDDVTSDDDWDAAVVFLGSNYGGDLVAYEAELAEILDRLEPRPVLLLTVTEYRPNYVEVNVVVNRMGAERDNATVLDWKTISETPGVLSDDRLHPTDAGRQVLADAVAQALGPAPDGVGDCLRSTFRNDSVVDGDSNTVLGRPSRIRFQQLEFGQPGIDRLRIGDDHGSPDHACHHGTLRRRCRHDRPVDGAHDAGAGHDRGPTGHPAATNPAATNPAATNRAFTNPAVDQPSRRPSSHRSRCSHRCRHWAVTLAPPPDLPRRSVDSVIG